MTPDQLNGLDQGLKGVSSPCMPIAYDDQMIKPYVRP
jgi:hypothetical protein